MGADLEPLAAFRSVQWDAVEAVIGRHSVLTYEVETPRESVRCLVWGTEDGRLFQTSASNSYVEPLAESLLDRFTAIDTSRLRPGEVSVVDAEFLPVSRFEVLVIAPPEIAIFGHLPEDVRSRMHVVAPAFRSEFKDGMSVREYRHQVGRKDGWRVHVYRWDRLEKTSPSWE